MSGEYETKDETTSKLAELGAPKKGQMATISKQSLHSVQRVSPFQYSQLRDNSFLPY